MVSLVLPGVILPEMGVSAAFGDGAGVLMRIGRWDWNALLINVAPSQNDRMHLVLGDIDTQVRLFAVVLHSTHG